MSQNRILVVDDDQFTRELLGKIISRYSRVSGQEYEVILANDGEEALALFEEFCPAFVIVDLFMPKMDGFELCKALRAQGDKKLAIAVTSGVYKDASIVEELRDDYGVRFFAKPYELKNITEFISSAVPTTLPPPKNPPHPDAATLPSSSSLEQCVEGDLSQHSVAALYWHWMAKQATGSLTLQRQQVVRKIDFFLGHPVSVNSSLREETLGHLLMARKRIDSHTHAQAMEVAAQSGMRLGEALLSLGALSPQQLLSELGVQSKLKLKAPLRWTEGSWSFVEGKEETIHSSTVDLREIIVVGLAQSSKYDTTNPQIRRLMRTPIYLNQCGIELLPLLGSHVSETFTQHYISGKSGDDWRRAGMSDSEIFRCIDILDQCRAITDQAGALLANSTPQLQAPTPQLPDHLYQPEQPLPPPPTVEQDVELDADFDPEASAQLHFGTIRADTAASESRVKLLEEYLRLEGTDLYTAIGSNIEAKTDEIKEALLSKSKEFSIEKFTDIDLGRDFQKLDIIKSVYLRAQEVLLDPAKKAEYDKLLKQSDKSGDQSPSLHAELRYRDAELALEDEDYAKAIVALNEAIAIRSDEPAYHASLAWAHFIHGDMSLEAADHAREILNHAISLSPDCASAHEYKGRIHAHLQDDIPVALLHLENALEAQPRNAQALLCIEELLTQSGDFRRLESIYRRTLFRLLSSRDADVALLWTKLGDLLVEKTGDLAQAENAYRSALSISPNLEGVPEKLASLEHSEDHVLFAKSTQDIQDWKAAAPTEEPPHKNLYEQAIRANNYELAWHLSALAEVQVDNSPLSDFYRRFRPPFVQRIRRPLNENDWQLLRHPADSGLLDRLFATLREGLLEVFPVENAQLEIEKADLVSTSNTPKTFSEILEYACGILGAPIPTVHSRSDLGREIQVAATTEPAILAGYDILTSSDKLELAFRVGRAVSFLRGARSLCAASPGRVLKSALLASYLLGVPDAQIADPDGNLQRFRHYLHTCELRVQYDLQNLVAQLSTQQHSVDLSAWATSLNFTADRAGLLLCGDLPLALRLTRNNGNHAHLCELSISSGYSKLRRSLGISIDL